MAAYMVPAMSASKSSRDWKFAPRNPMAKERDPTAAEFFNDESLAGFTDALVRECIQNSLDAADGGPVEVNFRIRSGNDALKPAELRPYTTELWPHIERTLPAKIGLQGDACRFLVIEDYGTFGLTGDPTAAAPASGTQNHFYFFVRAEGKSGKSGKDRGRWGLGKNVFTQASEIKTFFLYSLAKPPAKGWEKPLLIGQSTLLNHELDEKQYQPDGWWADYNAAGLPVPIGNFMEITQFAHQFAVARKSEPGLSLVIPHLVEDVTAAGIAESIVREYYIAILDGRLKVAVEDASDKVNFQIDIGTLRKVASALQLDPELERAMDLAAWGLGLDSSKYSELLRTGSPSWDTVIKAIPEPSAEALQSALVADKRIALRVPISVDLQDGTASSKSFVDVLIEEDGDFRGPAVFVREGIRVPRVDPTHRAGARIIVLVRDQEAARMVGDAEGPAHTDWSPRGDKFKGKYRDGQNWLSFVKRAPAGVLKLLRGAADQPDKTIAIDFFSLPDDKEAGGQDGGSGAGGKKKTSRPPPPPPLGVGRRLQVVKVAEGFTVRVAADPPESVREVNVVAAYDVRRGSPVARWSPADFDLADLDVKVVGGRLVTPVGGNRLSATVTDPSKFKLQVKGFDTNRDLYVNATEPKP